MNEDGLRADRELDRRIGEVLRTLRQSRRMSLEALGQHVGVTYQQIQKYETGANRISASTLYRLAQVLGCDLGVFFKGISGKEAADREVQVSREDIEAARALDRIEDRVVSDALRKLISLLEGAAKAR